MHLPRPGITIFWHIYVYSSFQQRILQILAQQAAPVAPNLKSGPTTVPGSPSAFDPFAYFPTIMTGWGTANVAPIRRLSNVLNTTLYVLSSGALDINRLRANNFVVDPSQYPDIVLRGIIKYSLQVYKTIYSNNTAPFKTPVNNKAARVQALKNFLTTFQIPDGGINAFLQTRIGGNLKLIILDTLDLIK